MAAKIFITGATGAVGRALVRALVRRGKEVRAGVHTPEKFEYIRMSGVEMARLEFGDNSTIDKALLDIKSVFLLTPFAREQVEFARRIIDRASQLGVEHVVKLSIMGADDEPGTQFTRWHKQAEKYIEKSGIPYTFLRPNSFMQNFIRYIQPTGNFIYLPLDNAQVSYIDVRNIADIASEILISGKEHFGNSYELTGPEALSGDDVADILTSVTDNHIGFVNIAEETAGHVLESLGTPHWMAEGMLELYRMQRSGRNAIISPVIEEITGKKPKTFEKFADEYSNVFKTIIQQEHQFHK